MNELLNLDAIKLKGHVTVSLYDADGSLLETIEGDNFISVKVAALLRRMQISAILNSAAKFATHQPQSNGDYTNNVLFNYLVLTDYAGAEAPTTEQLVSGNLIGWANRSPTSETSVLAGYANHTETWATPNQLHLVFDFATDKAIGTFRSVYLALSSIPGVYGGDYEKTFLCRAVREYESNRYSYMVVAGGYFWAKLTNTIYKISMTTGEELAAYDMLESVYSFTVIGGYIYYLQTPGTALKRYAMVGGTKTTLTLSSHSTHVNSDDTDLYAFRDDTFQVIKINPTTFTEVSAKTITPPPDGYGGYGFTGIYFKGGLFHARFYDMWATLDPDTGWQRCAIDYTAGTAVQETPLWSTEVPIATDGTTDYVYLANTGYMGNTGQFAATNWGFYTTKILAEGNYNIFSRKLLAAPVTKANNQTMKISYDIFIS